MKKHDLDALSLQKAREFFANGAHKRIKPGSIAGLMQIHVALFGGFYEHAGKIRALNISKGDFRFANCLYLESILPIIENMPDSSFEEIVAKYVELNIAHPFTEGNDRAGRIWLDVLLRHRLGLVVDWSRIGREEYLSAMRRSPVNDLELRTLLLRALTDAIDDQEIAFKGLEQSYYYEGLEKEK